MNCFYDKKVLALFRIYNNSDQLPHLILDSIIIIL